MSMYIYGTNIDRMPGSAPLDGVSFLCCWRESHCHPKKRETAYACKHLLPNYLAGSNVQRYLFTFTDFNMMEWNVFNISYIQLLIKIFLHFFEKIVSESILHVYRITQFHRFNIKSYLINHLLCYVILDSMLIIDAASAIKLLVLSDRSADDP